MQMEVLRDESNKSGVARLYNRTNTYTHATARSGPTKHTQMSIGIDSKHTHHARKKQTFKQFNPPPHIHKHARKELVRHSPTDTHHA